jgi:hypothetical protein
VRGIGLRETVSFRFLISPEFPLHAPGLADLLTSEVTTLLQVVDALSVVALAQLLPHQSRHHALHPLLSDHGILRRFKRFVVVVVHAVEGWWNSWLGRLKHLRLGSRHVYDVSVAGARRLISRVYGEAYVPILRCVDCSRM